MLLKFNCECGNTDPKKAKEYDGSLGYEAIICLECGRYYDNEGVHSADVWSLSYLKNATKKSISKQISNGS